MGAQGLVWGLRGRVSVRAQGLVWGFRGSVAWGSGVASVGIMSNMLA